MKILHNRSKVVESDGSAKEPTLSQLEYGELALNYSADDPAIFLKDSNDNIVKFANADYATAYVNVDGDNMTGDLTLGTDRITLNATSGIATFAGTVTVSNGTNSSTIGNDGSIAGDGNLQMGTYLKLGTNKVQMNVAGDGSVELAGGLSVGGPQESTVVAVAANDINCNLGNYFTKTVSGNSSFTFSNAPAGKSFAFTLEVTHNGGTITWPSTVKWPADTAPTLTTGKTHLFVFVTDDGGSRWRGAALVDYVN